MIGSDGAGPGAREGAVGDGVHQVSVEPHGHRRPGQPGADLVLAAADEHVTVAVDLAVNLDGLPGRRHRGAGVPLERGGCGRGPGGSGAAHGQERQVLRQ